jgi:hypothetical protein
MFAGGPGVTKLGIDCDNEATHCHQFTNCDLRAAHVHDRDQLDAY